MTAQDASAAWRASRPPAAASPVYGSRSGLVLLDLRDLGGLLGDEPGRHLDRGPVLPAALGGGGHHDAVVEVLRDQRQPERVEGLTGLRAQLGDLLGDALRVLG